jgi:hypothetical protein
MWRLWRKIRATGRVAQPAPERAGAGPPVEASLAGSVQLRHVDAGSCNGCEIEISAAFGPVYDPVTRNMAEPLRRTQADDGFRAHKY